MIRLFLTLLLLWTQAARAWVGLAGASPHDAERWGLAAEAASVLAPTTHLAKTLRGGRIAARSVDVVEAARAVEALDLAKIHGNARAYVGETHVYVIRDMEGRAWKIGESMQGVNRLGESKRARAQANKLMKQTGQRFETDILKVFETKDAARTYETQLIERFRGMYGHNRLPGNKGNR